MRVFVVGALLLVAVLAAAWLVLDGPRDPSDVRASLGRARVSLGERAEGSARETNARDLVPPSIASGDADVPAAVAETEGPFAGVDPSRLEPLRLTGRVVFSDGEPVAGALVLHALGSEGRERTGRPDVLSDAWRDVLLGDRLAELPHTRSADDGCFVLATQLVPDPSLWLQEDVWEDEDHEHLDLLVQGDGLASARFTISSLQPGVHDAGDLVVERGTSVMGRVVDERHRPRAGVHVSASANAWDDTPGRSRWLPPGFDMVASDADGRFELAGLWRDAANLTFTHDECVSLQLTRPDLDGPGSPSSHDLGEIVLTPAGRVAGRVLDADGRPVAGATVYPDANVRAAARWRIFSADRDTSLDVTTDGEGRFAVRHAVDGSVRIVAVARGFDPAVSAEVSRGARDVRLVLPRARALRLELVDPEGAPAAVTGLEAWSDEGDVLVVRALDDAGVPRIDGSPGGPDGSVPVSDGVSPSGRGAASRASRYLVLGAGDRAVTLTLEDGAGRARKRRLEAASPGDGERVERLVLGGGRSIAGRVVDADGQPVVDAMVSVHPPAWDDDQPSDAQTLRTDADGRFASAGLPPETYLVSVGARDGVPEERDVVLGIERDEDLGEIVLRAASVVRGRIERPEGAALPECVELEVGESWLYGFVSTDGRFLFARVPPGHAVLSAEPGGVLAVDLAPGETYDVTLRLLRGPHVEGRVLDVDGAPVPGAIIDASIVGEDWRSCPDESVSSRSDAQGNYELDLSMGGEWELDARRASGARSKARLLAATCDERYVLDLVLELGDAVHGVVVDAESGEPVADADVRLGVGRAVTSGDGRFELVRNAGSKASAFVQHPDYVPFTLQAPTGDGEDLRLELVRGASLEVSVFAPGGIPALQGTTVVLVRRLDDGTAEHAGSASVSDGRASFTRLPPGSYELVVPSDGASDFPYDGPGEARARMPISLGTGESLELVVTMQ